MFKTRYSDMKYSNKGRSRDEAQAMFNALYDEHDGKCFLCGRELMHRHIYKRQKSRVRQAMMDHDHETGMVRGLLCHQCNMGLGCLQDDPALMIKASMYVSKNAQQFVDAMETVLIKKEDANE